MWSFDMSSYLKKELFLLDLKLVPNDMDIINKYHTIGIYILYIVLVKFGNANG